MLISWLIYYTYTEMVNAKNYINLNFLIIFNQYNRQLIDKSFFLNDSNKKQIFSDK